ncbi:MAG: aldehyde dehydrogenase (NADP(+)) [Chitinophagaceae bacterium]|nr:aldehyde dehydrogenase (NADP(+)) [Chitinophagaceae bacterium]MCW5925432.1 aldehyde dehydrogenase (NADP(+)) [Chitinophagaceae bacterium]
MTQYADFNEQEINQAIDKSREAFLIYRKYSLKQRADFMRAIAEEMEGIREEAIALAMKEAHLPYPRIETEFNRTIFQLTSYAAAAEDGWWMDIRIDTADKEATPPKTDIRKTMVPLGPVAVFGASNFPFAYSTAGGDTACAFAAGCPVIVKAHPAHPETSDCVAGAILRAARRTGMPEGIFTHIHGAGVETGKTIVMHPQVKAVGFTGSYAGGKALYDFANQRPEPIPVFSEMGSINPVYLFPEKLKTAAEETARQYAASITLSVGQFCTNPGLILGVKSESLDQFIKKLGAEIRETAPAPMLHPGIAKAFASNRARALMQKGVTTESVSAEASGENEGIPTIASVEGSAFLNNPVLHQEVFGPYSLVVKCSSMAEMQQIADSIEGQLTSTLIATDGDIRQYEYLVDSIKSKCGRVIVNGVPTGVQVCVSMHHGGPFPATTDSRFTSVGADGIRRFARPLSYQGWPDHLLPPELANSNPLRIWRTVNNELTRAAIPS